MIAQKSNFYKKNLSRDRSLQKGKNGNLGISFRIPKIPAKILEN
jgi:hypothetical protein